MNNKGKGKGKGKGKDKDIQTAKQTDIVVFIFRRDLRTTDNPALTQAVSKTLSENALFLPVFIFNDEQANPIKNKYFSQRCFDFFCAGLVDLKNQLPALKFFYTDTNDLDILKKITNIIAIYENFDTTPYAQKRSEQIKKYCDTNEITYNCLNEGGNSLRPLGQITTQNGTAYTTFSHYYNRIKAGANPKSVQTDPIKLNGKQLNFYTENSFKQKGLKEVDPKSFIKDKEYLQMATRKKALTILKRIKKGDFKKYEETRDRYQDEDGTTNLSSYHNFGLVSLRETWEASSKVEPLQRELVWNQFNQELCFHKPEVLQGQISKKPNGQYVEYQNLKWNENKSDFEKLITSKTGFPLIDASVQQLLTTGKMHNRLRMTFANFAVKFLQIDWRKLEQWFAQYLEDYNPIQNNLNWQWNSVSTVDYMAMIRIFSPQQQLIRFDPECVYVKHWIPSLKEVSPKIIKQTPPIENYEEPIKPYKEQREKSLQWLKQLKRK